MYFEQKKWLNIYPFLGHEVFFIAYRFGPTSDFGTNLRVYFIFFLFEFFKIFGNKKCYEIAKILYIWFLCSVILRIEIVLG